MYSLAACLPLAPTNLRPHSLSSHKGPAPSAPHHPVPSASWLAASLPRIVEHSRISDSSVVHLVHVAPQLSLRSVAVHGSASSVVDSPEVSHSHHVQDPTGVPVTLLSIRVRTCTCPPTVRCHSSNCVVTHLSHNVLPLCTCTTEFMLETAQDAQSGLPCGNDNTCPHSNQPPSCHVPDSCSQQHSSFPRDHTNL